MKLNIKKHSVLSLALIPLLFSWGLKAQDFSPAYYWTFDTKEVFKDRQLNRPWTNKLDHEVEKEGALLGNYFQFGEESKGMYAIPFDVKKEFSIEFWLKPDQSDLSRSQILFFFNNRKVSISMSYPNINFSTLTNNKSGIVEAHNLALKLDGVGKKSLDYYMDGNWHHFVFQYQVQNGIKEVWVDGELLEGMRVTDAPKGILCGGGNCNSNTLLFTQFDNYNIYYKGGIDEIALYKRSLPGALIRQHYSEIKNNRHYSFRLTSVRDINIATPEKVESREVRDKREFAPSHPRVRDLAYKQLQNYPLPRYKKTHRLKPLVNWMALDFFGGAFTEYLDRNSAYLYSAKIQEELSVNWNYSLTLYGSRNARKDQNGNLSPYTRELIKLANKYPDIPLSLITLWAQVIPKDLSINESSPRIYQTNPQYAVKNASKVQLNRAGKTGSKEYSLSPITPDSYVRSDGQLQALYIKNLLAQLRRPINLINENGEVPFLPYPEETLKKDPRIVRDKEKSKVKDWDEYQAIQKNRLRRAYSKEFLKIPALKNTEFTWYGVDGGPQDRFAWKTARKIGTKINGQYYSTPDFYVRWPSNWNKVRGAWRGWSWIEDSRKVEIAAGDNLFSPFIAAGWSENPEQNVRPSQWLGLLKCLGPIGAEFFYTGFFNVKKPFADPRNYAWQAVMPSYAQAVSSYYEGILRKGSVLRDGENSPIISLEVADPRILATARKSAEGKKYVIALTIQPQSNIKGNVPDQAKVEINLEGNKLSLTARRQGSVYVLDLSTQSGPIIYQLDSWHETGHPAWWSQDFHFEAEVYDYSMGQEIKSETQSSTDFSKFDTYLKATEKGACSKYHFQGRNKRNNYSLRVRARNRKASGGRIGVVVDGADMGELKGISSKDWKWYNLSTKIKDLDNQDHMLSLIQSDPNVEIDKFILVRN
ncbi:MAG: LamG-like jellyroll fold domain-containing protein [Bacteroidia bacterium]|nr:LamG-like jellyroll fold domain-containing protein [Bacteroidia bacterium]